MPIDSCSRMTRCHQVILIGSFLPLCWLGMMAVHELGHVLAAWSTGGTVLNVVLHPLAISRTDVAPNPEPLIVAWCGPVIGVMLPLAAWGAYWLMKIPGAYLLRFFAGFCLIANGAYLSVGAFVGIGDAGDMLRHGSSPAWLLIFGVATVPPGLMLWHRLGPHFGLGASRGRAEPLTAYLSLLALAFTLILLTIWEA